MRPHPPVTSDLIAQLAPYGRYGVETDVPLAPYTSFRIGGPAAALVTINDLSNLIRTLDTLYRQQTPFLLLGGGSNVLISDAGIPAVVILNQCKDIVWPEKASETVSVQAQGGAALAGLARSAIKRDLAGLTWAVSIPGTVAGAVIGNAGAHDGCIADNLHSIRLWSNGEIVDLPASDLDLSYRHSRIKETVAQPTFGPVVLTATFQLQPDLTGEEQSKAEAYIEHRRSSQPVDKSAGSIFKNPPGDYAGRLIEAAGLKGAHVGGASVSSRHANFIINGGDASAADVVRLMNQIREAVFSQFGVALQPEIRFIGDWSHGPTLDPLPQP